MPPLPGPRKILTVHSPIAASALDALLTGVEEALTRSGAHRVWIDASLSPDLAVMADFGVPHVRRAVDPAGDDAVGDADAVSVPHPR